MATTFPSALDTFTNPLPTNLLAGPSHSGQHSNSNDAIEALEDLFVGPVWFNPKGRTYGAIGGGAGNDGSAINAALTAAGTYGTVILYGRDTYRTTEAITLLEGQTLNLNGSTIVGAANNLDVVKLTGVESRCIHGRVTKEAGTTGVRGVVIANPDDHVSYSKAWDLHIYGNGAGDRFTAGVALIAGKNIATVDMGCYYCSLRSIRVRYCDVGFLLDTHSTNLSNGANGTFGQALRAGDCGTGWKSLSGDGYVSGFAAEGCTLGIHITKNGGGADNNKSTFTSIRFEANTADIQIDANCNYNNFYGAQYTASKITDNGTSSGFWGTVGFGKGVGWKYTSTDNIYRLLNQTVVEGSSQGALVVGSSSIPAQSKIGTPAPTHLIAPSTGNALVVWADAVGRGVKIVTADYDAATSVGSGIDINPLNGTIAATSAAGSLSKILKLGGQAHVRLGLPASTAASAELDAGTIIWSQTTNFLIATWKKADGTVLSSTVATGT